jgi:eukaryotic-like serine/threonine-protein kinase
VSEVEAVLENLCSGRESLESVAQTLARGIGDGTFDRLEVLQAVDRFLADGRLEPVVAAALSSAARPAVDPAGLTLLRPSGTAGAAAPSGSTAPLRADASGASSGGWRQWASEDVVGTEVGVGTVLRDRFLIEEVVGEGGMGLVFRARDRRREEASDRNPFVAIKVLGAEFKSHPDALIALQREARRMQQLSHPNIASVYDFDRDGPHVYLVMELLEGESLDRVLLRHANVGLPVEQARNVIESTGKALQHAHSRGLVHSDFKPANVFVTRGGEIKVIDFGIARIAKDTTQVGQAVQTVFDAGRLGAYTNAYASPEQMLDAGEPDPKDDIYALGLVAYEVFAGKHPFGRKSAVEAKFRDMKVERVAALTDRQNAVLASALHFDRDQRLGDITELVQSLTSETGEFISATDRIGHRPAAAEATVTRAKSSRIVALAVVAVAWFAFFGLYWSARDGEEPKVVVEDAPQELPVPAEAPAAPEVPPAETERVAGPDRPATVGPAETPVPAQAAPAALAAATVASAVPSAAGAVSEPPTEPLAGESGATQEPVAAVAEEPEASVAESDETSETALFKWTDRNGVVQFGEKPPPEYAESAVKVMDL